MDNSLLTPIQPPCSSQQDRETDRSRYIKLKSFLESQSIEKMSKKSKFLNDECMFVSFVYAVHVKNPKTERRRQTERHGKT